MKYEQMHGWANLFDLRRASAVQDLEAIQRKVA
jgi:hypothetical protein